MATWLILGATSSVGRAFARLVAAQGAQVLLAGRDLDDLKAIAADIDARGGSAEVLAFDALDSDRHADFAADVARRIGPLNVFLCFGAMPSQAEIDADVAQGLLTVDTNYRGAISILHRLAPHLEAQAAGEVIVLGSVAGDRGRPSNYVYGSAKAGLHAYLQGLRARLFHAGVNVLTVKPGFTDTAMTWGLDGMFLVNSPEALAKSCLEASSRGRSVLYAPAFWRPIMAIIRAIPEAVFKRLKL
ncbi:MAG: SDR family oxidoreductase [Alphaproteobacteria bacterium]